MISLLIAGGVYMASASISTEWPDIDNHILRGQAIPSSQVVCRNRWGTPMLPDGKGGYSLIAPINQSWIDESLIIPPRTNDMVAYRPLPPMIVTTNATSVSLPGAPASPAPAPAASPAAPAEAPAPAAETSPNPFEATPAAAPGTPPAGN